MANYKIIFSGVLEFGTNRSFDKVMELYLHRLENYYKNDLFFKEEVFDSENFTITVPRFITESITDKTWKNTVNMLGFLAEFAVAGKFDGWLLQDGQPLDICQIEPIGDKSATQSFLKGRQLIYEKGAEQDALDAINEAIARFGRHAMAYERRGYINLRLRNYADALYDYNKSISIYGSDPEAHFGRGQVHLLLGKQDKALEDFKSTMKTSIPHQPIYWSAFRLKAEMLLNLGQFAKAVEAYKFVVKREFDITDPNYKWRRFALYNLGKAQLEVADYKTAIATFDKALQINDTGNNTLPSDHQLILHRGIARQKAGQKNFKEDLKTAAHMGSEKAKAILEAF